MIDVLSGLARSGPAILLVVLASCQAGSLSDAGSDTDAGPGVCQPLPTDTDDDTISDAHESKDSARDTDGDETADWEDDDSDGDGRTDVDEAGDGDPCTPPRDTDGDGQADFRSTDSDANSILDGDEPAGDLDGDGHDDGHDRDDDGDGMFDVEEWGDATDAVDSDGDELPDYRDVDSDDDGVDDRFEGPLDVDSDDVPSYLDADADGDGIMDAVEGPAGTSPPRDSDDDGAYDFLDFDADNDGLPDGQEDLDGDGLLDPGETSALEADTDGDSYTDLVEWAAGTDGNDPASVLAPDDFYFILPMDGPEVEDGLVFSTSVIKADVFIECDTTGSMGGTISTLSSSLQTVIVPQISSQVANVAMGAGWFKDFPVGAFGEAGDLPYKLEQRITTVVADVQTGIDAFAASGGNDLPESGIEALYQTVAGEGVKWSLGTPGEVPKFTPLEGFDPSRGHGLLGGVGFRAGALPIIIHATDITFHDGTEYIAAGITGAHTRIETISAAKGIGARFIGVTSSAGARAQLEQISRDTQAIVPPEAWGPGETFCHTDVGGALVPPDAMGLCPLTFDMAAGGSGIDQQVVDGVKALVTYGVLDISARAVADPDDFPVVDTSKFITAITPLPPAPPGATIVDNSFKDVRPGDDVSFTVHARNAFVEHKVEAQLFRVTIRVMGDGVTVLDERDVYVIVPGGITDP